MAQEELTLVNTGAHPIHDQHRPGQIRNDVEMERVQDAQTQRTIMYGELLEQSQPSAREHGFVRCDRMQRFVGR